MSSFPKSPQEANSAELTMSDPIKKVDILNSKSYYFTVLYGCFIQTQVIPGSHKMSCDKVTRQKTILANRQCLRVVVSRVVWRCVLVGFFCVLVAFLFCSHLFLLLLKLGIHFFLLVFQHQLLSPHKPST